MKENEQKGFSCSSRRQFLLQGSAATATVFLAGLGGVGAEKVEAAVKSKYKRIKIGSLKKLKTDKPVEFNYPDKKEFSDCILVKLGTQAGGGVGPNKDVVAFSSVCTHMGGGMADLYQKDSVTGIPTLGPCPFHLSTFDLTRHGIIVSGHATESIAQVTLETKGDDIYATGMIGLLYGRHSNV
jgi:arsenite oxidase small subunit